MATANLFACVCVCVQAAWCEAIRMTWTPMGFSGTGGGGRAVEIGPIAVRILKTSVHEAQIPGCVAAPAHHRTRAPSHRCARDLARARAQRPTDPCNPRSKRLRTTGSATAAAAAPSGAQGGDGAVEVVDVREEPVRRALRIVAAGLQGGLGVGVIRWGRYRACAGGTKMGCA